jgi:malate dehydrogenase (oxaloacetate-decarboxylating)(NADP+)
MIDREEALRRHAGDRPGKIEVAARIPCQTPRDVRLAYLPGALHPAREIAADPTAVWRYTARGNLVAVVTNGSAVPGLGAVGASASKPMQEGMAVLFKRFADIDVFDLEIDAEDPERFVDVVRSLEPTFGAINLRDLRAPDGLRILELLSSAVRIPVFHDNLYATAVVASAALLNALELVDKRIDGIRVVVCGAGTVGLGCARLLQRLGVSADGLRLYDEHGLLHPDRTDLHEYQREFARQDRARDVGAALRGADVFLGASAGGILSQEMVRSMARFPVVLALATPEPEIRYEAARASRHDVIAATAEDRAPNAVVDLLSFPYILRGALDVRAERITDGMLLAAARALADLARDEVVEEVERAYGFPGFRFGPEYLIPKTVDPRILVRESAAVAQAAIDDGVAGQPLAAATYQESLNIRLGTGRETMRRLILMARRSNPRVVFADGTNETILRACSILLDEGICRPVLLGNGDEVRQVAARIQLDLGGVQVVDPSRSPRLDAYAETLFRLRGRRGLMRAAARRQAAQRDYFAALMVDAEDADVMIAGVSTHYAASLRPILEVVGTASGVRRISGHYAVLLPRGAIFLADCAVNVSPDAEELAEIALLAARLVHAVGDEPRVAMLSFSNFGSVDHERARTVRRAVALARERAPDLHIDGEMQLAAALDEALRREFFPFSVLDGNANVLIFPGLESGNLAVHLLQYAGGAVPIGPVLMGTRRPAHLLQYGFTVDDVVHLTTVGVVQAGAAQV